MNQDVAEQDCGVSSQAKIGYREVARTTDARSFIGAVLPSFPCGHRVPIRRLENSAVDGVTNAAALFNSFVFDWVVRQRLGAAALAWYVLAESALSYARVVPRLLPIVKKLNLFPSRFAAARATHAVEVHDALHPGERVRLRSMYATVLLEIRSRNLTEEDTYWTTLAALRDGGDLDEITYGRLLDKLHARGLLDDIGYRHRRGRNPPAPAAEPLLRVAEPRTDYRVATPPQDRQTDVFE